MSNMGSCGFTACKAIKARCDYCALGNNSVSLNSTQTSESEINPPIIK